MFLAYAAMLIDVVLFGGMLLRVYELVLPTLILQHTPVAAQIIFFGEQYWAVVGFCERDVLAPSGHIQREHCEREWFPMSNHNLAEAMQTVLVCFPDDGVPPSR